MPDQLHHQLDVTTLPPPPKRGRPSLLGDLEKSVMEYIKALRVNGRAGILEVLYPELTD